MVPSRFRAALAAAATLCAALPLAHAATTPEQQLNAAVELLRAGHSQDALQALEALTRREPSFRLAQLLHGELLAALSGAGAGTLLAQASAEGADPRLADLAEEARVRLASEKAVPPEGSAPNGVLALAERYKHVVVVDLPRARLYLMENRGGRLHLLRHHYAAMGKKGAGKEVAGDQRTPVGVYQVVNWIGDEALPELYGSGALPLDYPNLWDQLKRRTGSGIWLHGVPRETYSRPPRSSEGCVTMANADLSALHPYMDLGRTPVLLSNELQWLPEAQITAEREAFQARIEGWRQAWSARDTAAYLAYYTEDFRSQDMDRTAFAAYKHRVNASKRFIDVQLRDISIYRYPGAGEPLMLVEFTQDYRSDNYSLSSLKQQFWKRSADGQWKIYREESR